MDDDTAAALRDLVDLAETFPGAFKPEFELGYWAGVTDGAEPWYVVSKAISLTTSSQSLDAPPPRRCVPLQTRRTDAFRNGTYGASVSSPRGQYPLSK